MSPVTRALAVLLFFQAAAEMLVAGFLTTFLTLETGASVRVASGVLAGFWLAMMITGFIGLFAIALALFLITSWISGTPFAWIPFGQCTTSASCWPPRCSLCLK